MNLFGVNTFSLLGFGFIPQILCVIHAYRTGRREWIFPLFVFSWIGVVVYFVLEIFPEIKHGDFASNMQRIFLPNSKIKEMERKFKITDTLTNRINLAEAYAEQKKYTKAIELAEPCLDDPFVNQSGMYLKLARLYFHSGQFQKSVELFEKSKSLNHNRLDRPEDELLYARAIDALGDKEKAAGFYQTNIRMHHSMAAMYFYGKMLKDMGQTEEANAQFVRIKEEKSLHPRYVRRLNAKWIRLAAKERRTA